jgi:hypothetical protein
MSIHKYLQYFYIQLQFLVEYYIFLYKETSKVFLQTLIEKKKNF